MYVLSAPDRRVSQARCEPSPSAKKCASWSRATDWAARDLWGGTLPSKTLWEISKSISHMTSPTLTGRFMDPSLSEKVKGHVDHTKIMDAVRETSEVRERQINQFIKAAGIEVINGKATFENEREIDVYAGKGEYNTISSDYFLIATGSVPREHPLYPCDHKLICNSNDIFKMPLPKSIVIIGAGPMGCEFAAMFANMGTIKVFLVDKDERILPREDEDLSDAVYNGLVARGVTVHRFSQLFDMDYVEDPVTKQTMIQYSIQNMKTGKAESITVERALVTMGRRPYNEGLGLENLKVHVKDGVIDADNLNRCKPYKHIYCVGDATKDMKTVSAAQVSARHAINSMYGASPMRQIPRFIPNMTVGWFFDEEVAAIGMNESQCQERHIGYIVAKQEYTHLSRGIITGQTKGFVKLIVTNDREKRVLGVRAMGMHAGSIVELASLAIRNGSSAYELLKLNPAYPSVAVGLVECVRLVLGRASRQSNQGDEAVVKSWVPDHFSRGRAFFEEVKKSTEPEE
ncbi:dihydrolipoamide dehydrogenase [Angomonas deanei]|nr:dihydrolipoamide dehydrogenase [Angomonas deanei]|eukprot:EPY27431.1 dihydrolipoamide dehydrogenase [Angomonas deanei]